MPSWRTRQDAAASFAALAQAREHALRCHRGLADVRDGYRMRAEDVGCTPDKGLIQPEQAVAA
jgi:hypothetical protein